MDSKILYLLLTGTILYVLSILVIFLASLVVTHTKTLRVRFIVKYSQYVLIVLLTIVLIAFMAISIYYNDKHNINVKNEARHVAVSSRIVFNKANTRSIQEIENRIIKNNFKLK